jgi:hypothetical protein
MEILCAYLFSPISATCSDNCIDENINILNEGPEKRDQFGNLRVVARIIKKWS